MTVDQRGSRTDFDRVDQLVAGLRGVPVLRGFERTAGDEVQAVLDDPDVVVGVVLDLVRRRCWSVGVGIGPVQQPLPASTRAGRGPVFEHARTAVERAKGSVTHLAVVGPGDPSARDAQAVPDAQAVLDLLAVLVRRRSPQGWAAVDLATAGRTQAEVAEQLGVTKQAVSQRLRAAGWQHELAGRRAAAGLLARADALHPGDPGAAP